MRKFIIPYKPRYPEVHAKLEKHRFCVLVAHRRFGKTVLAVNHLIKMAYKGAKPGGHYGYVAPFRNQAKSVAWDYLKRYTANLPGRRINESDLSVDMLAANGSVRIRLFGADNPDALRGLYFDGVVLDEVAQMKPDVWEEIIQPALADRQGFALFIGTPKGVNLFSETYNFARLEEAQGNPLWCAMSYPVTETNALPAEEVERLREELSENKYRQEMLCDFTASSDDKLITLDEVEWSLQRKPDLELAASWPLVIGVDVARFGEDSSVFFARQGNVCRSPLILRKKSNVEVAHRLVAYINELQPAQVNIDQGQGTGVIDLVRELCPTTTITEVPFGSRPNDETKYNNRRSEMWALMRDWIRSGGCMPIKGKIANDIRAEFTAPSYSYDEKGRIKLEPKDKIKERLKHSTDIGDALALTFAINLGPMRKQMQESRNAGNARKIYDPFKE